MSWNYRIVRYENGGHGLHEVYYDEAGNPRSMTIDPISFAVDDDESEPDLIEMIERALRDAKERPVIDERTFIPAASET